MDDVIYLDNAATTWPKPEAVYRAVETTMRNLGANPGRSSHRMSLEAERIVDQTSWDAATQQVTITKGGTTVELTIGSTSITTNGQTSQMDMAPVIVDGRTYLPVRYVAAAFGCNVSWSAAAQTVIVSR